MVHTIVDEIDFNSTHFDSRRRVQKNVNSNRHIPLVKVRGVSVALWPFSLSKPLNVLIKWNLKIGGKADQRSYPLCKLPCPLNLTICHASHIVLTSRFSHILLFHLSTWALDLARLEAAEDSA